MSCLARRRFATSPVDRRSIALSAAHHAPLWRAGPVPGAITAIFVTI